MPFFKRTLRARDVLSRVLERHSEAAPDDRILIMQLAAPNCSADRLRETMERLSAAWARLTRHRRWRRAGFSGYFRTFYAGVNAPGKFSARVIALIAVNRDYLHDVDRFITTKELSRMWRAAIRAIRPQTCVISVLDGTVPVDALCAVTGDRLPPEPEARAAFARALQIGMGGMRLHAYGGMLAVAARSVPPAVAPHEYREKQYLVELKRGKLQINTELGINSHAPA